MRRKVQRRTDLLKLKITRERNWWETKMKR